MKHLNIVTNVDEYFRTTYGLRNLSGTGNLNPWPTHSKQPYWVLKKYGIVDSAISNLNDFYLLGGPFTKPEEFVAANVANIENGNSTRDTVMNIVMWEHGVSDQCADEEKSALGYDADAGQYPDSVKRSRTASEIIKSRCFTGCTDFALVFAALARAKKISATVTETIAEGWVAPMVWSQQWNDQKMGHFFSEVFLPEEERWIIVDPTGGVISSRDEVGHYICPTANMNGPYDGISGSKGLLFERGLDHGDYGVETTEELSKIVRKRYYIEHDQP
jgi:hypothetical protein